MQEPDGAIPWTTGGHTDTWNHVEAAMALLVGGEPEAAHRAYDWCLATQRADGSWPMKVVGGRRRRRQRRDQHVGLPRGRRLAPLAGAPRRALRAALLARRTARARLRGRSLQLPFGGIAWSRRGRRARSTPRRLLAGSASIFQALTAGIALVGADGRRRSRSGSSPPAGSATRCASTATCSSTSRRSRWTGTTRCSAAPSAATTARDAARRAVGRLRRARPRDPLRRHQPVGDRRRDLRAGRSPSTRSATGSAR